MIYLSALLLGFFGSFHCVGMCGPIALSLPNNSSNKWHIVFSKLIYNLGRIITYSILGLIVGLIGHSFAMAGFQKYLSIGAGTLILLSVAIFTIGNQHHPSVFNSWVLNYTSKIKGLFKKLFGLRSRLTLLFIGIVNGLLPCGFVYIALAAAIATGSYFMSSAYMFLFGSGTIPAMLSVSLFGNFIGIKFRNNIRKATPCIAVVVAMFLIYRGFMIHQQDCCHH